MADHLGALLDGRFEMRTGEFVLARLAGAGGNCLPHGGGEENVLQRRITAKLTEHLEILSRRSAELNFGNAVEVDDPGKLDAILISVKKLSQGGREMANAEVRLPGGQETHNLGQNIRITDWFRTVVESWCVYQGHHPPL